MRHKWGSILERFIWGRQVCSQSVSLHLQNVSNCSSDIASSCFFSMEPLPKRDGSATIGVSSKLIDFHRNSWNSLRNSLNPLRNAARNSARRRTRSSEFGPAPHSQLGIRPGAARKVVAATAPRTLPSHAPGVRMTVVKLTPSNEH